MDCSGFFGVAEVQGPEERVTSCRPMGVVESGLDEDIAQDIVARCCSVQTPAADKYGVDDRLR
jgi:hypothetical protein